MSTTSTEISVQVGAAWSQHYQGKVSEALSQFEQIVARAPEHLDANFGLALCLKTAARKQAAIEAFTKTKDLAQKQKTDDDDEGVRNRMIARMVDQQLAILR